MKKAGLLFATVLMIMMFGFSVSAETEGVFEYSVKNNEATITKYVGSGGELVIPDTLGGFKVTAIGDNAFSGCSDLSGNLVIPESVVSIGIGAFHSCRNLTGDLIIPDSVTTIGYLAFAYCSGFDGELIISDNINSIEMGVFIGCEGLIGGLVIPERVTTIGNRAFENCSGFTGDLIIPNSVESVGNSAFAYCGGFDGKLIISSKLATIGWNAFTCCRGLVGDLIIPDSVVSIGNTAFYLCEGLSGDLVISDSVTSIGDSTFGFCDGLKHICFEGNKEQWDNIVFGANNSNITNSKNLHLNFNKKIDVTEVINTATCFSEGNKRTVCSCGYLYGEEVLPKVDCLFINYIANGDATCLVDGTKTAVCDYGCGNSDTINDVGSAKGHSYSTIIIESTCTQNGYTVYTCACGYNYTETIEPTGHNFEGSKCTNCDFNKADDCSCKCHKGGISGFFFKLILFFQKLFRTNKTCSCGVSHY